MTITRDDVICAFSLMLGKEPESERIIEEHLKLGTLADVVHTIANSAEFRARHYGTGSTTQSQQDIFDQFQPYEGPGTPGFATNFLGVKTSVRFTANIAHLDGIVETRPSGLGHWHGDLVEWAGTLSAALEAKGRFVAVELGAGWGPWLVIGAFAAKSRGIDDIQLIGLEADKSHFEMMIEHFRNNGLEPADHTLLHAAVGVKDGRGLLPVHENVKDDWGKAVLSEGTENLKVDYRGYTIDAFETVPVISVETIFAPLERVNLMHVDIQGSEAEVIESSVDTLNRKLASMVVGTHTRQIESQIPEVLARNDWVLRQEMPCEFQVAIGRVVLVKDGCQWWVNPRLSSN